VVSLTAALKTLQVNATPSSQRPNDNQESLGNSIVKKLHCASPMQGGDPSARVFGATSGTFAAASGIRHLVDRRRRAKMVGTGRWPLFRGRMSLFADDLPGPDQRQAVEIDLRQADAALGGERKEPDPVLVGTRPRHRYCMTVLGRTPRMIKRASISLCIPL
jgi:hypothetical protein